MTRQNDDDARLTLVLVIGPIASGKSTVARLLGARLREAGERVAVVGLDEIAEMALPTLPGWDVASGVFASVVGQWLGTALDVVVAEGPGNPDEVGQVLAAVPAGVHVVSIVLTSELDVALARAQADPTRGISQNPDFLGRMYQEWAADRPLLTADLTIDTGTTTLEDSVAAIRAHLAR
ncbi:AAA family ATPase [Salana multivorans]